MLSNVFGFRKNYTEKCNFGLDDICAVGASNSVVSLFGLCYAPVVSCLEVNRLNFGALRNNA